MAHHSPMMLFRRPMYLTGATLAGLLLVMPSSILLDDGDRPDEREMVGRWQAELEGFAASYLPLVKGAWLLRMP